MKIYLFKELAPPPPPILKEGQRAFYGAWPPLFDWWGWGNVIQRPLMPTTLSLMALMYGVSLIMASYAKHFFIWATMKYVKLFIRLWNILLMG